MFFGDSIEAATITIDTDVGSITGDGDGNAGALMGVPFVFGFSGGVAEFRILGDMVFGADKIVATGINNAPVSLIGGNNVTISPQTVFNFAGDYYTPGPGGGHGGVGGVGGFGGLGGDGGSGGGDFVLGAKGKDGDGAQKGAAGLSGVSGFNASGSGGQGGGVIGVLSPGAKGGEGGAGFGSNGLPGETPPFPGRVGASALGGTHTATGTILAGGGGGGGGAGGDGGNGGGGGGGGSGASGPDSFGGGGGQGGEGNQGGSGGEGGGGGGAIEISALGILTVDGMLTVAGGDGIVGQSPLPFSGSGQPGEVGVNGGGDGGNGGNGAQGGFGGHGGGGAGGTVRLIGTVVNTSGGNTIDVQGGFGAADSGEDGRFVLGRNTIDGFSGTHNGFNSITDGAGNNTGTRAANPFLSTLEETALLPNLLGGAEAFGLAPFDATDASFDPLRAALPAEVTLVVLRKDLGIGPLAANWDGWDVLLLVNLSDDPIESPQFGIGSGHLASLVQGGFANDPAFGGAGDPVLSELPAQGIYAIMIPDSLSDEELSLSGTQVGQPFQASNSGVVDLAFVPLGGGEFIPIVVPEPSAIVLGFCGLLSLTTLFTFRRQPLATRR